MSTGYDTLEHDADANPSHQYGKTFKFSAGVCSAYHKTTSRPRYTFHSRLEPYSAGHMMPRCLTLYVQRMGLAIIVRLKPQDSSRTPGVSPR